MKDFLKNFFKGSSIGLGILIMLGIGYLAVKARQTTNPNIADDGQGMYATNGSTLTAGKWNEIVDRTPLKVKLMQGTLGTNQTTVAHGVDATKITNVLCSCYDNGTSQYLNLTFSYYNGGILYRNTNWTTANIIMSHTSLCNSQAYKCTIYYLP